MEIPQQCYKYPSPSSSSGSLHWSFTDCPYCCHCKRATTVFLFGCMAALVIVLVDLSLVGGLFTWSNRRASSVTKNDLVNQNQEKLKCESLWLLSSLQIHTNNTLLSSFEDQFNDFPYTSYNAVMDNGFPLQWDDCVVPKAIFHHHQNNRQTENSLGNISSLSSSLPHQKKPFRIVIMGGSASAIPPSKCNIELNENATDVHQGRYSNQLEKALNHDFFSDKLIFQVENMAQGGTDSGETAWILDQFVDPTNVDMIVWEFAINDEESKAVPEEMMEFWFQRVTALFALAGQSHLPPLVLLYLWDAHINNEENQKRLQHSEVKDSIPRNYSSSALRQQWETIQYYKSHVGWDIQIIHVGATIDVKAVLQEPSILFDDYHHPSCKGSQVFISMIQYAIYRNIASCMIQFGGTHNDTGTNNTGIALMTALSLDEKKQRIETTMSNIADTTLASISKRKPSSAKQSRVLDHLSHSSNKIRVASFTLWEPRLGLHDSTYGRLKIAGNVSCSLNKFVGMAAISSQMRADRKYSLRLPPCGPNPHANTNNLEITLNEPTLQWIGLRYGGYLHTGQTQVGRVLDMSINGVHVFGGNDTMSPNNINHKRFRGTGIGSVPTWVYVPDFLENNETMTSENQSYTISLCQHSNFANALIHHIIGVMKPQQFVVENSSHS